MKDSVAITTVKNPDLDGYACAIGYAELLRKQHINARAAIFGRPLSEVIFVINYTKSKILSLPNSDLKEFDAIVLVDKSTFNPQYNLFDKCKVTEVIDHRKINETHLFSKAKLQIELIGACATLITEKFIKAKIKPETPTSFLLYGAICSNTINFKNSLTSKRDIAAADYLKKLARIPDSFTKQMFVFKSNLTGKKLIDQMTNDALDHLEINDKKFTIFQIESVDCKNLVKNRINEIEEFMEKDAKEKKLDFYFINMIDVFEGYNFIISPDRKTKKLLGEILRLKFYKNVARADYIIMRKEIVAKIKEYF